MHGYSFGVRGLQMPLYEPADVGGGAVVEHPTYEVPSGVGAGGDTPQGDQGAGPTPTGADPISGREPAAGASRDGAPAPTPDPNAPAAGTRTHPLPAGRSDEIARRHEATIKQLETRLGEQAGIIDKLKAVFAPAATGDPKTEALRNRLMEVVPELKALAGLNVEELTAALKEIPGLRKAHDRGWETHAERTMSSVYTALAPFVLGADGKIDQFTEQQRNVLANSFRDWCLSDKTGTLVDRYERGDAKLVEEFRDFYASVHHTPAHRASVAAAAGRAAAGATLPRAGRADATGTPIPKADPANEDAVHDAAWKHVSNALRSA